MGILGKIFKGGAKEIIDSTGNAIDKIITNKEERGKLKNEFAGVIQDFYLKANQELSKRHANDMTSDSWLSKNVRPMTLVFLLGVICVLSVTDGNLGAFTIRQEYITLFQGLLTMVFAFYFGSRGVEKVTELIGKYNLRRKKK